jgi:hypothetical protein
MQVIRSPWRGERPWGCFPRIARWRHDKPAVEADTLASALALLAE